MRERSYGTSPEEALRTLEALNARAEARQEQARRRRRRVRSAGLVGGLVLTLGLVAVNVVIWDEYIRTPFVSVGTPDSSSVTRTSPSTTIVSKLRHPAISTPATTASGAPPSGRAVTAPGDAPVVFRIKAVRGGSWLMVRKSGPAGAVVYSGILSQGRSVTVRGARLWVRFGAVANLDLVLNGESVRPAHTGTIDAVVDPSGLSS